MKIIDQLFSSNRFMTLNRTASQENTASNTSLGAFSVFQNSSVPGMDKVETLLRKMDYPLTESQASSVESFMANQSGSTASKLETIEWAADKDVELTEENLKAIHETLNNEMNESEMIETLSGTKEVTEGETEDLLEAIKADRSIPKAFKEKVEAAVKSGLPIDKAIVSAVNDLISVNADVKGQTVFIDTGDGNAICIGVDQIMAAVAQAFSEMQGGSDLSFEDLLKSALADVLGEDALAELADDVGLFESAIDQTQGEVASLDESQSEDEELDIDVDAEDMDDFEKEIMERLEASFDEVASALAEQLGADVQEALDDTRFKSYLVTKVTEQAIEAKETFNQTRKEILSSLKEIESDESALTREEMKENLEKSIDKLDNMLMKSDVTLYTSMKMEKNLLNMSSELQEARKLLAKGDVSAAKDIVKNVSGTLEKMIFKPSEKNIELMAFKQASEMSGMKQASMPTLQWQNTSMRGVVELFRDMGLNHEPEVAEKLLSSNRKLQSEEDYKIKDNLKAVLLKLAESDDVGSKRAVEGAEKALNNLTGQQLMNKLETKQDTQTLFFHIPLEADGEVKDMRLYVNSRKNGDSIDWENASLYFSVELKKYGETGILLQSNDKLLSISVRNDDASFEEVMEPMVNALQKEFVNIGYKLGPVRFSGLSDTSPKELIKSTAAEKTQKSVTYTEATEKGFDFSI